MKKFLFIVLSLFLLSSCGKQAGPVIDLNGEEAVTVEVNTEYIETASAEQDGINLEVMVSGNVDTSKIGTYTLVYSCESNGLSAETLTRTVNVVDTTAPAIAFPEYDTFEHEIGQEINMYNVLYSDNYDVNVDIQIVVAGDVDVNTLGDYEVSYYAVDTSGNQSETITKTVHIVEKDLTLSEHHRFMKDNTAFYDPVKFDNSYIYDPTETVYRGVIIENGEYKVVYYMFFHNLLDGAKVLNKFEWHNPDGENFIFNFSDDETDFVFPIPVEFAAGNSLQVTTYAHDEFVSQVRRWTAKFSFLSAANLDPYQFLEEGSEQGNR